MLYTSYYIDCYGQSAGFRQCWFLPVKSRFYAGCMTKRKGHLNPWKLLDGTNHLHAKGPDGNIGWLPGMVSGSRHVAITRNEWTLVCMLCGTWTWALRDLQTHFATCSNMYSMKNLKQWKLLCCWFWWAVSDFACKKRKKKKVTDVRVPGLRGRAAVCRVQYGSRKWEICSLLLAE